MRTQANLVSLDGAPRPWLQPGPALAVVGTWGVNQHMEDWSLLHLLPFSKKKKNLIYTRCLFERQWAMLQAVVMSRDFLSGCTCDCPPGSQAKLVMIAQDLGTPQGCVSLGAPGAQEDWGRLVLVTVNSTSTRKHWVWGVRCLYFLRVRDTFPQLGSQVGAGSCVLVHHKRLTRGR